eukprot:1624220-Prymnesium_polylepis.1
MGMLASDCLVWIFASLSLVHVACLERRLHLVVGEEASISAACGPALHLRRIERANCPLAAETLLLNVRVRVDNH